MDQAAADTRSRILFWVTHLLGIGHLRRATTLARALEQGGFAVTLASGGMPVPHHDCAPAAFVQLPPVRAVDLYFKQLVDAQDRLIDDGWRADRRDRLLAVYERVRPDIVVTELFPFGRRQLSFEVMPLLEIARADGALTVCSVRDILVEPGKPERLAEMLERVQRRFDLVLVHGDPTLVPFDETFPQAPLIADRLRYTGYVIDPPPPADPGLPRGEVLVSAGGGAVGEPLLRAALAARSLSRARDLPWRLLVGHNLPPALFDDLRAAAAGGVIVERARPDFTSLLRGAALSISQGGYNTVMEVLDAGCRAVIVPYAGGHESEQTLRAKRLADRGLLQLVPDEALAPETLALAIDRALAMSPGDVRGIDTGGGPATARLLHEALAAHPRPSDAG